MWLMKRIFVILIAIVLSLSVCSCHNESPDSEKSNLPEEYVSCVCTKDSVDEFLDVCDNVKGEGLLSGFSINKDNLYNVTPVEVAASTDVKIFKTSDSCASFVLIDGEIYPICESFGGYGFVNAVPCDFDDDGNIDLLVASSWGSGIHRSIISVFNTVTKKSTVVYDTMTTQNPRIDLFVAIATQSTSLSDSLPVYYNVYTMNIKVNDNNFANLSYVATDMIGTVKYENGEIVFKPISK